MTDQLDLEREREAFEAWANTSRDSQDFDMRKLPAAHHLRSNRDDEGGYLNTLVEHDWRVWLAARRASVAAEPVEPLGYLVTAALARGKRKFIHRQRFFASERESSLVFNQWKDLFIEAPSDDAEWTVTQQVVYAGPQPVLSRPDAGTGDVVEAYLVSDCEAFQHPVYGPGAFVTEDCKRLVYLTPSPAPAAVPPVHERFDRTYWLEQWDAWRSYIAKGGGGSWPRDAFESLLEHVEELLGAAPAVPPVVERETFEFETIEQCAEWYEGRLAVQEKGMADMIRKIEELESPASVGGPDLSDVKTWQDRAKSAGDFPAFSGETLIPHMKAEIADLRALLATKPSQDAPASVDRDAVKVGLTQGGAGASVQRKLRRGTTGVCIRSRDCVCEQEGLGDECIWLVPAEKREECGSAKESK